MVNPAGQRILAIVVGAGNWSNWCARTRQAKTVPNCRHS